MRIEAILCQVDREDIVLAGEWQVLGSAEICEDRASD
jgi:hypothetical protein